MKRVYLIVSLLVTWLCVSPVSAQSILSASRQADWTRSGSSAITATRAQCGSTVAAYTGTADVVNAAIAACGANQYVLLGSGTFTLSSGIWMSQSNVTLRGAGANATSIVLTGDGACNGVGVSICVTFGYLEMNASSPSNVVNWTAGYAKGDTALTLSSVSGLSVGYLVGLFQDNDVSDPGVGLEFICSVTGLCSYGDFGGGGCTSACNPRREQQQWVEVTAINGNVITISDPLIANNWSSGHNPKAAFRSAVPITGVGIEHLSITHCSSCYGVAFMYATNSWVKGVKSVSGGRNHVDMFECLHCEVRDSYLYESQSHASTSYGIECIMGSYNKIENNIVTNVTGPFIFTGSCPGTVVGYNYSKDDTYAVMGWQQSDHYYHATGNSHNLHEGNIGVGGISDNVHGPSHHITFYRNYFKGRDADCYGAACTSQTNPIHVYSQSRFFNVIGNVLGDSGYHTTYEAYTGNTSNCYLAIVQVDFSGNECNSDTYASDTSVRTSLMRWGNYDTVGAAVRWDDTEVPSAITGSYDNPVPGSHTLASSLYLSGKPSWFRSLTFPGIGPDVSGGTVTGVGGHVFVNPAKACYDAGVFSGAEMTNFNADTCYSAQNRRRFLILRR